MDEERNTTESCSSRSKIGTSRGDVGSFDIDSLDESASGGPEGYVQSMHRRLSNLPLSEQDEAAFADRESTVVSYLRLFVMGVLVSSAVCTAVAVYFFTRNSEMKSFRSSFDDDAQNIAEAVGSALYLSLGTVDTYISSVVSIARATNQTFPFVTVPDAAVRLSKLRSLSKAVLVNQAHFVTANQKEEWEEYASKHDQWAHDALRIQKKDKNYDGAVYDTFTPDREINSYKGFSSGEGPFLPSWHASPFIPVVATYNIDALAYQSVTDAMPELLGSKRVVISKVSNMANESDPVSVREANTTQYYIKDFIRKGDNASEPFSLIFFPILEDAADHVTLFDEDTGHPNGNHTVVGMVLMMFFWRDLIRNILVHESDGLICVFENPCNQTFSYEIFGPNVTFLGRGDWHDEQFTHLNLTLDFDELAERSAGGRQYTGLPLGGETCPYTLRVYPSTKREEFYMTDSPMTFTISAILIFVFTSGVFLIYDVCVERRQRKVMYTAVQSSANVALLECMVRERTRRLEETNMRLEEANRRVTRSSAAQLEHFACMSHEIRTPLNCIIGLSSLLLDTDLSAMQEESMRMIVTSGDLLLTVVNDVLDYSKLESGNVEINVVRSSLQDTLNAVVQAMETKAQPKKLSIRTVYDTSIGEFVHIDYRRLQQILFNLLGNAVKFSLEEGTIDLNVSIVDSSMSRVSIDNVRESITNPADLALMHASRQNQPTYDKMLRFVVKDCGRGIEAKDFQTIFQPFRQASAETERVYGGTGLGLAVTAKLIKSLGGNVSVDSQLGEWSEFTVELPFQDTPVDVKLVVQRLKDTRILLVDDDMQNVSDMSRVFRQCGVDFYCYQSMEDMVVSVAKLGLATSSRYFICLVHEQLYSAPAFQSLADTCTAVLLTHGPKYAVKTSKGHYRSLTNVLPSVLMESFASFVESVVQDPGPAARRSTVKFANDSTPENLRILIAEDNKINQKVLLRILKRLHFENVEIVDDGKQACDIEAEKEFDVILMDIQMPVMTGIEACKIITSRSSDHPKPKIVFVTAHVSDSFEAECRAAGGVDFLPKPFNIGDIENCLRRNTQPIVFSSQDFSLSPSTVDSH